MNKEFVLGSAKPKLASILVLLVLLIAGAGISVGVSAKEPRPIDVGMIPLLASPEKYDGKMIRTIGFLHIGPMRESDILCLYEDDGKFSLFKNTFALDLSDSQRKQFLHLNHTYVLVEGTLHSEGAEGTRMNSGVIGEITQLEGWQPFRPSPGVK